MGSDTPDFFDFVQENVGENDPYLWEDKAPTGG